MPVATGLPNPDTHADFYADVPTKRLLAWVIDMAFTFLLSAPFMLPFALLGLVLFFPFLMIPVIWIVVGTLYRWMTISSGSATWGMRIMAIELRDAHRRGHAQALVLKLGFAVADCDSRLFNQLLDLAFRLSAQNHSEFFAAIAGNQTILIQTE